MNNRELYTQTTEINNITEFSFTELSKQDITEDYCEAIITQAKSMKGYALNLALTFIFPEDNNGYIKFLAKVNISKQSAQEHIDFYVAKAIHKGANILPSKSTVFSRLVGDSIQDKVNNYTKIKNLLDIEYPSSRDVIVVNKILARGLQDKTLEKLIISLLIRQRDNVKTYFCTHSKQCGINKLVKVIQRGSSDLEIMQTIKGIAPINSSDNLDLKVDNAGLKSEIVELKEENIELKEENTELKEENTELKEELDKIRAILKHS